MTQKVLIEKLVATLWDVYDLAERLADCDEAPDGHKQPNDWMWVQMIVNDALGYVGAKEQK